jgi:NAD(P)-dependent dehydrogenase (short-subunit alcohol dehydrogenase family)
MKASHFQAIALSFLLSVPFNLSASEGVVLVTGANRGIGLEFVQQLQAKGYDVIGTARKPESADELKATGARVEQLDVTDAASVAALAESLDGEAIDILINNAGMLNRTDSTLDTLDFEVMERSFQVNSLGPLRVTQALLPNLRAGEGKKVVNITSRMGSIEQTSGGGAYSYRTSKTALNMINKIISLELADEGFINIVMHPGWVRTDMGGENATLSKTESVSGMLGVINGLTAESNGRFFNYDGSDLPW